MKAQTRNETERKVKNFSPGFWPFKNIFETLMMCEI